MLVFGVVFIPFLVWGSSINIMDAEAVTVLPEVTTSVEMSSSDVNRIVCQSAIRDVIFSEEKGITVRVIGRDAFVKFLIKKDGGEKIYTNTPSELFVVCGNDVFSMIAIPKRIPSQTIRLSSGRSERIKENISLMSELPFERRVIKLIKSAYTEDIPSSFTVIPINKKLDIFKDIVLTHIRTVVVEGEGISLKEYKAEIRTDKQSISLSERDFLRAEVTNDPIAIAVDKHQIKKGDIARIFIVEKSLER